MKLALFFLSCFVGFSYQERYIWPMPYAPRAHLMPLFYADGQPADIETSPVIQELDNQPKNDPSVVQDQEQKLLAAALSNFKPFTTTTTVLSTSTVTVSTPTTVKCIASFAFSTNSTSACARRRREIEEPFVQHDHKTAIEPAPPALEVTLVESLPTAIVKEISLPEIESSQAITADVADSGVTEERIFFGGLNLTSTVSVTKVATAYSYVAFSIYSTQTIAANGSLNCLPSGYAICA